jgi:PTS system cellobiose-specific IIB component
MDILLVCAAGMSTGLLVNKMLKESKERDIKGLNIEADSVDNLEKIIDGYDVIMLGPQVQYKEKRVKELAHKHEKSYIAIPPQIYGMMDGAKALDLAINIAHKK